MRKIRKMFRGFVMCQSTFLVLPVRCKRWDEHALDAMLASLPIIGAELGLLWAVFAFVLDKLSAPRLLSAALLTIFPYIITGMIHLDGFMDVVDAICSWRSQEKRREILKDSHVGSFACAGLLCVMLLGFASIAGVLQNMNINTKMQTTIIFIPFITIPIVSRILSGVALMILPAIPQSSYAGKSFSRVYAVILVAIALIIFLIEALFLPKLLIISIVETVVYILSAFIAFKSLGGINGDTAGFALTISELAALITLGII